MLEGYELRSLSRMRVNGAALAVLLPAVNPRFGSGPTPRAVQSLSLGSIAPRRRQSSFSLSLHLFTSLCGLPTRNYS
jgi:hypothetical protein